MSNDNNSDGNAVIFFLAGLGIGAIAGYLGGLISAPKAGSEFRDDLTEKYKELKGKTEEWLNEKRKKAESASQSVEELGV